MNENKAVFLIVMFAHLTRIIAFICITIAAIYFQKVSILWWYLLPALMSCSVKIKEDGDTE